MLNVVRFQDNAFRADSATVDATNWTENSPADWSIDTNRFKSVNPLTSLITTPAAHPPLLNCQVGYRRALTGTSWDVGIVCRSNSACTSAYFLDPIGTGPSNTMDIWRIDGPLITNDNQVGGTVTGLTLNDGDFYHLACRNIVRNGVVVVELTGYLNDVAVIQVIDSTAQRILTAGQCGIINWNNTNYFADFVVMELIETTPASPLSITAQAAWQPERWDFTLDKSFLLDDFLPVTTPSGAIAGTASWTWGQSGAITGLGNLAGAAALSFGQTGAIRGAGALAASAALTFAQTGAIGGLGTLAGSIALTFGQTGALSANGALAGSITLTFTATATADAPSGAMVGMATLAFGQTGALGGAGALAGTIALQFGQSGGMGGNGSLSGAAAFTFAHTADLKGAAALIGTAPLTFGQSGNLTAQDGAIAGTATITFSLSGAADQPAGAGDGYDILEWRRRRRG